VEAEAASRRRALRGAGGAHLGQLETAASAAKANASIVELETLALDEQQASGNELQPRALPAQCDRQRGGGAVVVRGEGADRLGHETPVVS
jgi:hypothetical protein